jgi:hypothetical protein
LGRHEQDLRYLFQAFSFCRRMSSTKSALTIHSNASDDVLSKMLLSVPSASVEVQWVYSSWLAYSDLQDELVASILELQRVENGRQVLGVEFHWGECQSVKFLELHGVRRIVPREDPGVWRRAHTVNNGTNDLMDLSALCDGSRGMSRAQDLGHRLECASKRCALLGKERWSQ